MAAPRSKPSGAGPRRTGRVVPSPPPAQPAPPDPRDKLWYTIGFTLAAFFFIIGVYQTMVEKDLISNYWLFMLSAGLLLLLRWWRQRALRG